MQHPGRQLLVEHTVTHAQQPVTSKETRTGNDSITSTFCTHTALLELILEV